MLFSKTPGDWTSRQRAPRNATRGALQVALSGGVAAAQNSPSTKHSTRRAVPQFVSTQPYRLLSRHLSPPVSKWRSSCWKGMKAVSGFADVGGFNVSTAENDLVRRRGIAGSLQGLRH